MSHFLSVAAIDQYERDGFLTPVSVFSSAEIKQLRTRFEAFEQHFGGRDAAMSKRTDLHILQSWAWDLVTDSRIVDPVTSLLGTDVLLWSMNWFIKEANTNKFVSFHQDANYWGLEPHDVVTAWIAMSDAGMATGPMEFVAGSHNGDLFEHDNTFEDENLLSRGQTVRAALDEENCVPSPLAAGQMSLHHVRLVHRSGPNTTDDRRIGIVLRYCATHVRQTKGSDTAVLVAGKDDYGHFELLNRPVQDFGEAEMAIHGDAVARMGKIIMAD
jgi:ectoine hydroxylase-related dioxygenase (phytanoyl-CoA dioxygenase family)